MADLTSLETSLLAAKQFMNHEKLQKGVDVMSPQNTRPVQESASVPFPQNTPQGGQPSNMAHRTPSAPNMQPHSNLTEESIRKSGLPDAIKEAMISHPIPDINSGADLNPDFIDRVSKKMNSSSFSVGGMRNTANSTIQAPQSHQQQPLMESQPTTRTSPIPSPTRNMDSSDLKSEIKALISESLDELIESKVNKMLVESKNIKENIHFRVGNKVFTGKISKVKTLKS